MTSWQQALLALRLLQADPIGLGGIHLQARSGPVRDAFLARLPVVTKLHPSLGPQDLEDGIDLTATLESGVIERSEGLLSRSKGLMLLTMAERTNNYLTSTLANSLDRQKVSIIALDESSDDDQTLPAALSDRLAFSINLDETAMAETVIEASERCDTNDSPVDDLEEVIVNVAVRMGISSLRAPSLALRAAKVHASIFGRDRPCFDDIEVAILLVLLPRATVIPENEAEPPAPDPLPEEKNRSSRETMPEDMLIEAVQTALPKGALEAIQNRKSGNAKGTGAGKKRVGNRRGRPLPSRDRRAKNGTRIDLIATLRSGVPWQSIRKAANPHKTGPIIRASDLRERRYEEHSDRLLIFVVDASGSLAATRLGETKGAVELFLADAYAQRDHVALIAFRNTTAEVLLPPTRSLVQTKRRLASLPGGGGTPLASGLQEAFDLALVAKQKGLTPNLVILTDGKANIALDGSADRTTAARDAERIASSIRHHGIGALLIDTGSRPTRDLENLSKKLDGRYVPLPRANAKKLSETVSHALRT